MEKMSKSNERRLLHALEKAAIYSRSEQDPDKVLSKIASDFRLNSEEIRRVVETYNKAKSVAFLKSASSATRASDFPLANANNVLTTVFAEKKASEKYSPQVDYASMVDLPQQMEKVASCRSPGKLQRDHGSIWKEAAEFVDECKGLESDIRREYAECLTRTETVMRKVSELCEPCTDKQLRKIALLIVNGHGKTMGEKFIDDVNSRMIRPRLPKMEKNANAVIFPPNEPFLSIGQAMQEGARLAKAIHNVHVFEKMAEDEAVVPNASQIYQQIFGKGKDASPDVSIDPTTGLSNKWSNYLRSLHSRRMLYNLYRFDPVIKSYPLDDVLEVYNEIAEITPSLSSNKAWMRAAMRRMLTQGKIADPFELKDMVGTESVRTQSTKNYAEAVKAMLEDTSAKGGGGGAKESRPAAPDLSEIEFPSP